MNKARLKSLIYNYEVRVVSVITDGVLRRRNKRDTLRKVKKEILRVRLNDDEKNEMWKFALMYYRHSIAAAARKVDEKMPDKESVRGGYIYTVLRKDTPILEHQKNELANRVEYRSKMVELKKAFQDSDKFYYCTAHKDCAAGHRDYQGKVYYRRLDNYSDAEMDFIRENGLMAVEDVVNGPVWLVIRPNCKHRLVPVSFEAAQNHILDGEIPVVADEKKEKDISYEEGQLLDYSDRLKMLVSVKKVYKDAEVELPEQMKLDIARTRRTVLRWKEKIKSGS